MEKEKISREMIKKVDKKRKELNLSVNKTAYALGMTPSYLSKLINGKRVASWKYKKDIQIFLDDDFDITKINRPEPPILHARRVAYNKGYNDAIREMNKFIKQKD